MSLLEPRALCKRLFKFRQAILGLPVEPDVNKKVCEVWFHSHGFGGRGFGVAGVKRSVSSSWSAGSIVGRRGLKGQAVLPNFQQAKRVKMVSTVEAAIKAMRSCGKASI
jgi:hypothetical protein